ncbi:MAG: polyhydroxyalkanoate depolymerase [Proteobacteria bacterium]|nr:polyhydroxyalkanoate depolymerase [Pseudomonadota bacterium]
MLFNQVDNRWLYNMVDNTLRALHPVSQYYHDYSKQLISISNSMNLPINLPNMSLEQQQEMVKYPRYYLRSLAGTLYVWHMLIDTYHKPEFGIEEVKIGDIFYEVVEEVVKKRNFCNLLHFKKLNHSKELPQILLVAPLSGHYATLLRNTVKDLLPFYDVYITDWKNARDVPLTCGSFDFNDYVKYMISFLQHLGADCHVMAVCQSTVPVLIALAMMSTMDDPALPNSVIMLGGPIDTGEAPTEVNKLATNRGKDWFSRNAITLVPNRYPGYMRLVYPGFLQLSGFMSMNLDRHIQSLKQAIEQFAQGDEQNAFKTIEFYTEYLASMDLTAEFYMQTMDTVFQQKLLVDGRLKWGGKFVQLKNITKTAIMAIEGENDDITGIGQTKSVLTLCKNLPEDMKKYILAQGVGHYGLFNGSKFRKIILPEIRDFTKHHQKSVH